MEVTPGSKSAKESQDLDEDAPPTKKERLSLPEQNFPKLFKSNERVTALEDFWNLVNGTSKHSCILTYLKQGGNCLDILHIVDDELIISPLLVLEVVNEILLHINVNIPQYKNLAYNSCQYLLNNYITLINKMLGLTSSKKERIVVLKLLTTIATISPLLAKDILLHVTLDQTNLDLLTRVQSKNNEVRSAYIHFVMALLVGGHFTTISIILEKRGLIPNIFKGLQYDSVESVILVLTVMKDNILENSTVSKTTKMKIFNTQVLKQIVNLYNWRGPDYLDDKKEKRAVLVDEVSKSRVNEIVHNFLLVLCTSHKFGVIFKDQTVGLSKEQNSLMHTVLQSLEKPWNHSYAGELVIKICGACPDLAKFIWAQLKSALTPRWSEKWLKAMQFAGHLLEELQPECMESYFDAITVPQIIQIIPRLVAPITILKALIPKDCVFAKASVKCHVFHLLVNMTRSLENYLNKLKRWPHLNSEIVRTSLTNYTVQHFPDVSSVLANWQQADEDVSASDYLEVALDLLKNYKVLAPEMLSEIDSVIDVHEFLMKVEVPFNEIKFKQSQIRITKLFLDIAPVLFQPKTELFEIVIKLSLELYYSDKDLSAFYVLHKVLENSGVFDGFSTEIDLWIDGVINLKSYSGAVGDFLCSSIKTVDEADSHYNNKLFKLGNGNFSPLVLILENFIGEIAVSKPLMYYFNFVILGLYHLQADLTALSKVTAKLDFISDSLQSYLENWKNLQPAILVKCKGCVFERFKNFSREFLEGDLEHFESDLYPNFSLNLLQAAVFYLINLHQGETLKESHINNFKKLCQQLIAKKYFDDDRYIKTILSHPVILKCFSLFEKNNFITRLVTDIVQELKDFDTDSHLGEYRRKTVSSLSKVFTKPHKYTEFAIAPEILELLKLRYKDCSKLIEKFVATTEKKCFHSIVSHCLNRVAALAKNDYDLPPLNENTIKELSVVLAILIKEQTPNVHNFSSALLNYLETFPHNVENVEIELLDNLLTMEEYQKDNILLVQFLLDRRTDFMSSFRKNLTEICSKRSFLLPLLSIVVKQDDDEILQKIFHELKSHIIKALQKPHKAGQHFHNNYQSIGVLIDKFMSGNELGTQVQKFEVTELFHVYFLKIIYSKYEKNENMIMTFVHLLTNLLKQKGGSKPVKNLENVCQIVIDFLLEIKNVKLKPLSSETFKLFCKLCLKYGIEGDTFLLKILSELVEPCVEEDDAQLMLEMFLSHSNFLDVLLGNSDKSELLNLWFTLCTKWPKLMEKNHVPLLLSSYNATKNQSDKIILQLLKLYESNQTQTCFNEFKPFLWGPAAVSHYSVRSNVQKSLLRQPKMADVLSNLYKPTILETIRNPFSSDSYDLDYFLPLFSHMLAPENPAPVYTFIKSGALALTITGFMGDNDQRLASFYVLSRFHFHLDARQTGKDQLLWMRFVEVICKGVSVLEDFQVNNFVGVFLARTALVLTNPLDVMYMPLTHYLSVKDLLDFSAIPELYTFLHSSHVDSTKHRQFILEILRDGLRSEKDFTVLSKSMGLKLISELCSNTLCDNSTRILILDILQKCCRMSLGFKVLCGSMSFLTYISSLFVSTLQEKERESGVLLKLLHVFREIAQIDGNNHRNFIIYLHLIMICERDEYFSYLDEHKGLEVYYEILLIVMRRYPIFFNTENMDLLLKKSNDKYCKYLKQYECNFVKVSDVFGDKTLRYLRLLFYNKFIKMT